jgi:hypothetical protein
MNHLEYDILLMIMEGHDKITHGLINMAHFIIYILNLCNLNCKYI